MGQIKLRLLVFFVMLVVGLISATVFRFHDRFKPTHSNTAFADQDTPTARIETTAGAWEPAFLMALNERTQKVGLQSLRTIALTRPDLEMRFWYDGRPDVINGFVIRRRGEQWSAIGVRQTRDHLPSDVKLAALGTPRSGWQALWEKLEHAGLLTLPDGTDPSCEALVLDGSAVVVETNVNKIYRTYRYANPTVAKCDEAKRIKLIETIIADEFNLRPQQK